MSTRGLAVVYENDDSTFISEFSYRELNISYVAICIFGILLVTISGGGGFICNRLWFTSPNSSKEMVILIIVMYVMLDITLLVGFVYSCYHSYKTREFIRKRIVSTLN